MKKGIKLVSTITNLEYYFDRIEEFADNGESLEVHIDGLENAGIKAGKNLWERFSDFLPFSEVDRVKSGTILDIGERILKTMRFSN
jgi:threonine synthase